MLSDSHFEIEKSKDAWRVSARGLPALGFAVVAGIVGTSGVMLWVWQHFQYDFHRQCRCVSAAFSRCVLKTFIIASRLCELA